MLTRVIGFSSRVIFSLGLGREALDKELLQDAVQLVEQLKEEVYQEESRLNLRSINRRTKSSFKSNCAWLWWKLTCSWGIF